VGNGKIGNGRVEKGTVGKGRVGKAGKQREGIHHIWKRMAMGGYSTVE
jgi:hypothetical protein